MDPKKDTAQTTTTKTEEAGPSETQKHLLRVAESKLLNLEKQRELIASEIAESKATVDQLKTLWKIKDEPTS